jgi:hypothetical protein
MGRIHKIGAAPPLIRYRSGVGTFLEPAFRPESADELAWAAESLRQNAARATDGAGYAVRPIQARRAARSS